MQVGKAQLGGAEVLDVVRNNCLRPTGNGQFENVVVAFVAEVRTPEIINMHPVTYTYERFKKLAALCGRQGRPAKDRFASKKVFIFQQQSVAHNRLPSLFETRA